MSADLFIDVIKIQLGMVIELLVKVNALTRLLQDRGLSDADLAQALLDAQAQDRVQKMAKALEGSLSIQEILDQYEGPIQ